MSTLVSSPLKSDSKMITSLRIVQGEGTDVFLCVHPLMLMPKLACHGSNAFHLNIWCSVSEMLHTMSINKFNKMCLWSEWLRSDAVDSRLSHRTGGP